MSSGVPPQQPRGEEAEAELRRTAFGPNSSEAERADATQRLRDLESARAMDNPATPADTGAAAPDDAGPPSPAAEPPARTTPAASQADTGDSPSPARPRRSIPTIWAMLLAAAALVVGVVVGSALGPTPSPSATPAATPSGTQPTFADIGSDQRDASVGNLRAARARLTLPATNADTFPLPQLLESQHVESVRLIKSIVNGDDTISVWGARDDNDGICLLVVLPDNIVAANCALPKAFSERGITMGANGYEVSWDGTRVTLVLPAFVPSR